jgi:glycosyltransferase involved in cell wall biosynthesis
MIRVAYFAPLLATGGTQRHLQQVLALLDGGRFSAEVFTLKPGGSVEAELRRAGVRVSTLDVPGRLAAPGALRAVVRTARRLRREGVKIVHGYQWRPALVGAIVGRLAGVPLLLASKRSLTGADTGARRAWRRIARQVDTVIVNADALRVEGEAHGMRCRWELLRNGIDAGAFRPADSIVAAKRGLGLATDRPVIGTVGRLEPRKGHDVLLDAAARSCANGRAPWQVLIVGDGPSAAVLRARAGALGLDGDVRFTGNVDDVRPALAAMDVFVLPSREEGMSNALMEALAASRPVVATDVGGNGEVLDRGRLGALVPADDASALAGAVGALLDDPRGAAELGERGRAAVTAQWGARAMVERLETFYAERLAERRAA